MNLIIFITLSFLLSGTILAQHQHGSDSTKTDTKKMNCCKTMDHSNHEMKSEKTEISEKNNIDLGIVDKNKDGKVYQCPMCADHLADAPGECPKCGMDFKKITIEKAKENLSKKGFNVK
jgi:rubrerythrin